MAKTLKVLHIPHPGSCPYCVGPYRGPNLFTVRLARQGTSRISAIDAWRISSTVTPRL